MLGKANKEKISSFIILLIIVIITSIFACNDLDGMVGDTALFADAMKTALSTGHLESELYASTQDYIDRNKAAVSVEERLTDEQWITGPEGFSRNILKFHTYYILYLLAPFTAFVSGVTVETIAQVFSFFMALWLIYLLAREKDVPWYFALLVLLLISFHPGFYYSLYGPFYPDKLFLFAGMYLIYSVEKKDYSHFHFFMAYILCILIGERAALYTGAFLISWTILFWKKSPKWRWLRIAFGCVGVLYFWVMTHYVLTNIYYDKVDSSLNVKNIIVLFSDPSYQYMVVKFILLNLIIFGGVALFNWRTALIGFASTIPNLLYNLGGAEKFGWTLHYHSYYFTILIWAVSCGLCAFFIYVRRKVNKKQCIAISIVFVFVLCSLTSAFEPFSKSTISFKKEEIPYSYAGLTIAKARSFSGTMEVTQGFKSFVKENIPPGSHVSTIEMAMPYLYDEMAISLYPMNIKSADYIVTSYYLDDSSNLVLSGATSYLGTEETEKLNRGLQEQLESFGYSIDGLKTYHPFGIVIIPKKSI